ncbi:GumC family protein [Pedobacter metabolipauper]|uniref:non-specific protein-tyrosine kinase n=1 Tax=Pedobacter metabolipauper TaxID=425513 RepID=A0A4R6SW39_9SPHI|nr:polysaccharide biosynthesis tyrosine autokinase [Pedobacter metabolipauper]TDQ08629.1 capsular exopolysaccharide synthesis family protein [Pedobacter metabolipauper]
MYRNNRMSPGIEANEFLEISYIKTIRMLLSRWYWIVISTLFGALAGTIYLYFSQPIYLADASVKFDEKKSEIAELVSVKNLFDRANRIESEKLVIRSRNVLTKAIGSLDCDVSFFTKTRFRLKDQYPNKPVNIHIIYRNWHKNSNRYFELKPISTLKYELIYKLNKTKIRKIYKYGQVIKFPDLKFIITTKEEYKQEPLIILFNDQSQLIEKISTALKIDDTPNTSLLHLKIADANPNFAVDVMNAIVTAYMDFERVQRSASALKTIDFINPLLQNLSNKVKNSAKDIQQFKEHNQILSISAAAAHNENQLAALEKEQHELNIQNQFLQFFKEDLALNQHQDELNYSLLQSTDPQLTTLINKYNELVISKKDALNLYTPASVFVRQIDNKIDAFKTAITNNISATYFSNNKTHLLLIKQCDSIREQRSGIPKKEETLIHLQSKFDINQKVYNYLAEKKLEAQISAASVISGATIIDQAVFPIEPISPNINNTYTACILSGFIVGISALFAVQTLNPYIYTKEAIEQLTEVPILGIIPQLNKTTANPLARLTSINTQRSLFSESIRYLRSNLHFIASEKDPKIVCITSEVSGEGKSFISYALACTLTSIDKRVLLIAADLRKSKLHERLGISNENGFSKYLSDQNTSEQIIFKTGIKNLDFIPSGPIPPNPSELLQKNRTADLLSEIKSRYDYIILDTAPIGLVSDAKPLLKLANVNLFILRCGFSKKGAVHTAEHLRKELNLSNVAIILNNFKADNFHSYLNNQTRKQNQQYYTGQSNRPSAKNYFES